MNQAVSTSRTSIVRLCMPAVAAVALVSAAHAQWTDQTSTRFPTQSEYTNQCTVLDIDGDGDLDIVWANGQGYSSASAALAPRIYINQGVGTGVFADETSTRAAGITGWFRGVEAGDIDGDGDVDLILAQDFNKRPMLLLNNGLGVFTDVSAARLPAATLSSSRAQFGDVDNDGDLDIVLCNSGTTSRFGSGQPKLYVNNGAGFFTDATSAALPTGNISEQMDVLFFDADNDLDLDIFLGTRASSPNQSRLWKNDGTGRFNAGTVLVNDSSAYSYDAGDIDGDGDLDLIGVNAGTSSAELLLRNDGTGTTWTNISANISPNPSVDDNDSRFLDFDNDGDLDLIMGSLGTSERLYVNNGSGVFTQNTTLFPAISNSTLDIRVADFNNDGRLDVITAQGESGAFQNRIYIASASNAQDTKPPTFLALENVTTSPTPSTHVVRANIVDGMTSDRGFHDRGVVLKWTVDAGPASQVAMKWSGNNQWRGVLPALLVGDNVAYWVEATDWAGNVGISATKNYVEGGGPPQPGDLDRNGRVDGTDLGLLLGAWGSADPDADLNDDGSVDGSDLGLLLGNWTP
ncbi:MAG: FG-GAP-like repeat-containing protein [Phycisphaerales bacterium]